MLLRHQIIQTDLSMLNEIDTQQCLKDKGTCHPTICPTQKMSKGTCYSGAQLCCVGESVHMCHSVISFHFISA
uniref:Beta-defensin-like domain-containing protein n=1 Tax=Varanus komodoensis TaxID=61221 RepID=A0A8D2LK23_VARKO